MLYIHKCCIFTNAVFPKFYDFQECCPLEKNCLFHKCCTLQNEDNITCLTNKKHQPYEVKVNYEVEVL